MRKLLRFIKSTYKNVILKRKWKSLWLILTDKSFRKDLNHLYELTKNVTKSEKKLIPVDDIVHGHRILYPEYVQALYHSFAFSVLFPPIKVVKDQDVYRIVDGNHRYEAFKSYGDMMLCEVLS